MCHHSDHDREWTTAREPIDAEPDEADSETEPGLPSFLNETAEEDHEIITDGGDES
ncbi:hypothetical protein ACFQL1_13220 [Halomicroarcula sp. GCM10025709]|uniref:hypothetical protein n=1 Tax=Haloarcula TaxID=2237 RepID=UPI0024C41656|nr:hypothetical protein [Halomicroarcula sp. YJ-61-S]